MSKLLNFHTDFTVLVFFALQPFFMFLSHQLVHNPNDVPQRYEDLHADIKNSRRRKHAGMTSCLDESLNNITNTLIETGMWNNTILIFSTG